MERPGGFIMAAKDIAIRALLLLVVSLVLSTTTVFAQTVIRDEYWGGNTKIHKDSLGSASEITAMEVVADDEKITVTIRGPFFYNYVHHLKGADKTPPGDLYISSGGWKVKGNPPYSEDTFTKDEGWDYVVSLFDKAVYKLDWSKIQWTRPKPGSVIYRRDQAWRGGYGGFVSWADIKLTDKGLVISFPLSALVQATAPTETGETADGSSAENQNSAGDEDSAENENMLDIGLHWTMMCGNDVIEGAFALPATIFSDYEEAETMIVPRPTTWLVPAPPPLVPWGEAHPPGTPYWWWPPHGHDDSPPYTPPHKTPEPPIFLLLAAGLPALGFLARRKKP